MTPEEIAAKHREALAILKTDRWRAHRILFESRHPVPSSPEHRRLVASLYTKDPRVILVCFRGFGKTTYVEESVVLEAALREFKNRLLVGASYDRACERLEAIKRIMEQNEDLIGAFGLLKGPIWQESKIVLSNGVCIQALGRDQSMRGTKYIDIRPDSAVVDDIEIRGETLTPKGREKTWDWFQAEFMPGLDHPVLTPIKVLGTIVHPESFIARLLKEPDWNKVVVPVEHLNEKGEREATWPGKFPLPVIDKIRHDNRNNMATFEREYMCNAAAVSQEDFTADMIRIVERTPRWDAVCAMYDPARTTRAASATTGWAVWSWRRNKLVVWDAGASRWQPSEIIDHIFKIAAQYDPVWIGVEEDGLNEFIRQPLRHEMLRRGMLIPFRPVRAPRGKLDFIRGLQPYFAGGEIEFARQLSELSAQLLSFPTGDIDAPNALAYALLLKPGAAIYEDFRDDHVAPVSPAPWRPTYLAANARDGFVAAALVQLFDGQLRVLVDWLAEGLPEERVSEIAQEAALVGEQITRGDPVLNRGLDALKNREAAPQIRRQAPGWVIPAWHYDRLANVGLEQAIRRLPGIAQRGGAESDGREELRKMLRQTRHGSEQVAVSENARWTLRAFAGGYSRPQARMKPGGYVVVDEEAEAGPYRVLMEGLEAFVGMTRAITGEEQEQNWAWDKHGRRYKSAIPARG